MHGSPLGEGRLVFGLVTASLVFGLASQDTAENALAELSCTGLRFTSPVHLGDTLYAYTEVIGAEDSPDRADAGVVRFKHWGALADGRVVFEGERAVLLKRRPAQGATGRG
jgi:acyl dehydratase